MAKEFSKQASEVSVPGEAAALKVPFKAAGRADDVVLPRSFVAHLFYALVTNNTAGWVGQAAISRFGRALGGETYEDWIKSWEEFKTQYTTKGGV